MHTIHKKIIAILLLFIVLNVTAQDPHFSQYFASPLTVNPSFTGKNVEDLRIAINARSQWWGATISPYNTATLSFEKRLAVKKTGAENSLAIGGILLTDGSNNNILKNNFAGLSVAYNKALSADGVNSIGAGLSVHFANRILDVSKMQFQSQFGSMGFQRSIPSNDFVVVQNNSYVDYNAGINFSHNQKKYGYTIGIGYFHAGRPTEGIYQNNRYQIDPRTTISLNNWYEVGYEHRISFNAIAHLQGNRNVYTLGSMYHAKLNNDETLESLNFGLFHRFGDSFYPYIGLQATKWLVGISYDAVSSKVKTAYNSVSSMELSFVWQLPGKKFSEKPVKHIVQY
jgi:type IX secretion system PorP/SprF family membrane protein